MVRRWMNCWSRNSLGKVQNSNMKMKYKNTNMKAKYGTPCARCVPPRGRGAASRSPSGRKHGRGRGGSVGAAEKMFSRLMKIKLLKIQDQTKGFKNCFAIDDKAL